MTSIYNFFCCRRDPGPQPVLNGKPAIVHWNSHPLATPLRSKPTIVEWDPSLLLNSSRLPSGFPERRLTDYSKWEVIVVETKTTSWTGKYLYSDYFCHNNSDYDDESLIRQASLLNQGAAILVLGSIAGIARVALSVFHILGHLSAAALTQEKGHLYHALKGTCELSRGVIEAIPLVGQIFSAVYCPGTPGGSFAPTQASWWLVKMYNPQAPDFLDQYAGSWTHFKTQNPEHYIQA